ncbi:MAG: ABC transporter substrate-binding protein [Anaerolineales bacterium]|nr:ABC transporter substrate-binding protein [Anaerolineales bacterium]
MIIVQSDVRLADPHICSDARNRLNIFTAIFDALVRRDDQGNFIPALASSWQVQPDARHWQFQLRQDVCFHNGDNLTSADVVASLRRACDPAVGGELGTEGVWASYLGDAEISSSGPATVTIVTGRPMADLLDLLVAIPIMPAATLAGLPQELCGSGPYRFVRATATEVELAPFAAAALRQPAGNEPLIWRAMPAEADRAAALLAGEADLATDLSAASAAQVKAAGLATLEHQSNLCVAFLFNLIDGAAQDVRLRQAINYAVDVERMIAQARAGAATPLNGPLTPWHFGCDPAIPPYPHDPAKARQLLAEVGFTGRLGVDVPMSLPDEAPLLGQLLAEDLAAVGLEVELRHYDDRPAYAQMVKAKQIGDLCCFDSSPLSTYRVLREKINSDVAGPWWQGYANADVNKLLDQAAAAVDDAERQALYRAAYRHMHDEAPWIFLYRPTYFWGLGRPDPAISVGADGFLRLEQHDG